MHSMNNKCLSLQSTLSLIIGYILNLRDEFFHQVMEPSRFYCAKPPVASRGQSAIPPSIKRVLYCPWFFWWILIIGLFFSLCTIPWLKFHFFLHSLSLQVCANVLAFVCSRRMKITRHFMISMKHEGLLCKFDDAAVIHDPLCDP
jgi:hypothetical protein